MGFPIMWGVRPAKPQISPRIRAVLSEPLHSMSTKLLTEHYLELLSLKGGCIGSSESTLVEMPYCWKSRVTAQLSSPLTHQHKTERFCSFLKSSLYMWTNHAECKSKSKLECLV